MNGGGKEYMAENIYKEYFSQIIEVHLLKKKKVQPPGIFTID